MTFILIISVVEEGQVDLILKLTWNNDWSSGLIATRKTKFDNIQMKGLHQRSSKSFIESLKGPPWNM